MTLPDPGPLDDDVADLPPDQFAQLVISRSFDADVDQLNAIGAYINAGGYPNPGAAVMHMVGVIEGLLGWLGTQRGMTPPQLWRDILLNQARREAERGGG